MAELHYEDGAIPEEILTKFFDFLDKNNTTVKRYFDVNDATGEKLQVREVTETRQNDLKATLSLFQTIYPQYFDKLTQERILKAQKEAGTNEGDEFDKKVRDTFDITKN